MRKLTSIIIIGAMLILTVLSSGCTAPTIGKMPWESTTEEVKKLTFDTPRRELNITPGETVTFAIIVKNNRDGNESVSLSAKLPTNWKGTVYPTIANMSKKGSAGVFLTVEVPKSASLGKKYTIKLVAKSRIYEGFSTTYSVYGKIIKTPSTIAKNNSTVKVDYVGRLENGQVFDTTYAKVGRETGFAKTPDFTTKPESGYKPLSFTIGSGSMIKGFEDGIKGMTFGESRTIIIPPRLGYGVFENKTINLTENIKMYETMNVSEFHAKYGTPAINMVFTHSFWGWKIVVVDINENYVTFKNDPEMGDKVTPYSWITDVISIDSTANNGEGAITVKHNPVLGMNVTSQGLSGVVVNLDSTTVTVEFNTGTHSLSTKVLIFDVTITSLT